MTDKILTVQERTLTFYDPYDILPPPDMTIIFMEKSNIFRVGDFWDDENQKVFSCHSSGLLYEISDIKYWAHLPTLE